MTNCERILEEVYHMMTRVGLQGMTMDMVARNCAVSKRTLYENFPDKRSLIKEALLYANNKKLKLAAEIYEKADNSFEALIDIFLMMREVFRDVSTVVMFDVRRLYPEVLEEFRNIRKMHVEQFALVIDRAKEEGLALPEIDSQLASFLLFITMNNLHDTLSEEPWAYAPGELFDMAFVNFLRGIASAKGAELVDNYLIKNFKSLKDKK